jgi:DNA-binding MarR family transcriptional regulator
MRTVASKGPDIPKRPTSKDYELLLQLRTDLRRFLRWTEKQAADAGLTPAQHQLLLAIRGHRDRRGPTIGEVADYLLLRHNSAVGLVDRAEEARLIKRVGDLEDGRVIRLQLAPRGARALERLVRASVEELTRLARDFTLLADRAGERGNPGGARRGSRTSRPRRSAAT